jgi:glycosyltransferase involved in cell wall biosynthesis
VTQPRLLFVINDVPYFLAHWLERVLAFRDASIDVHVASQESPAAERLREVGLPFHAVPFVRGRNPPLTEMSTLLALSRLYAAFEPDLVHHVTIKPVIYGGLMARRRRVPAVINTVPGLGHVFVADGWASGVRREAIKQAYRLAFAHPRTRVIFENPDDLQDFERWRLITPAQGVVIKGAGVDLARFKPLHEGGDETQVVMASRLLWFKGVGEFVEAARRTKASHSDARFVLIGTGDPGNPATVPEAQLRRWADEGVIEWWGQRDDMPEVLARAAIVCLPSFYREGVPRVLIEAAACGRPIVTTDMPGCREIVRNGVNGLLVPARNGPALANAITRLLDQPAVREAMGRRSREIAQNEFGSELVIAQTLEVYRHLLAGGAATRQDSSS